MSCTMNETQLHSLSLPMSFTQNETLAEKGPLVLRRIRPHDFPAYDRINDEAFASTTLAAFYPRGRTPADVAWSRQSFHTHLSRDANYMSYLVTEDTSQPPLPQDLPMLSPAEQTEAKASGRVVAFSVWKIRPRQRSEDELQQELRLAGGDHSPSIEVAMYAAFQDRLQACKAEFIGGKPHVLLHLLAVDPEYHRRGIGGMHLAWGMAETDRLGVMGYLESSDEGKGLYERWGFKALRPLDFDARSYGAGVSLLHTIMIRPARHGERGGA